MPGVYLGPQWIFNSYLLNKERPEAIRKREGEEILLKGLPLQGEKHGKKHEILGQRRVRNESKREGILSHQAHQLPFAVVHQTLC